MKVNRNDANLSHSRMIFITPKVPSPVLDIVVSYMTKSYVIFQMLKNYNSNIFIINNMILNLPFLEHGSIVVMLVVILILVVASALFVCCCCFLETSGQEPERYIVFKSDKLNVRRQMLPKLLENSSFLVHLVSIIEEWRNKVLCIEVDTKNPTVVRCDDTGINIELQGSDKIEETNNI